MSNCFVLYFQLILIVSHSYFQYFFNLFKSLPFLSFSSNPLLKILPDGEYSNLACSVALALYPKSLDGNAGT